MKGSILEVLDTQGAWRCVRFASGRVGVVNGHGKTLLELGDYQQLEFADHGFLRVYNGREFFVDMKNGEIYAHMPEFIQFGDFEIASIGGFLCTRTEKLYEIQAFPAEVRLEKRGMYLRLPYSGEPEERIAQKMVQRKKHHEVCLLNGDERGVYWFISVFQDQSLLVMDDQGNYYHVTRHARSRRAVKRHLGLVESEADKLQVVHAVQEIEERVADRLRKEAQKAKREAEREREKQMATLVTAEPFHIGNRWGLKNRGRIVVPPIYRQVKSPVGRYCAIESYPGFWGVMAVDGKMEVEARYEEVVIHTDGTADLTVRQGKVISVKLGMRK